MKVVGLIAEYNPFHLGHKYHLKRSKQVTNSNYSIAVISGSFVQRGEPSFIDKWTKAKMAIDNGIDLVIELPFIFSTQSAELFALGSVKLLHDLNIVDYIAFGSEIDSLNDLKNIAKILVQEPNFFKQKLQKYLNKGLSFPVARSHALRDLSKNCNYKTKTPDNIEEILKMPNNILAIEYLKALIKLNSPIKPIAIKRIGSGYSDEDLSNSIASATGIRNSIFKNGIASIEKYVPRPTYYHLTNYIEKYEQFNTLDNYSQIVHYLININGKYGLMDIIDVEQGLENRFIEKSTMYKDINHLIQSISSKRYPRTRIQRILIHLMANLTKRSFDQLSPHHPSYIRVLGANKKGFMLLNEIKRSSKIPIITKFADYKNYNDAHLSRIITMDKISTDLYFMGLNTKKPFINMDYYTTPYIVTD